MGIKEDAEAAYAKTVEAKKAKEKADAEKLAADQAAAEVTARKRVEQWASDFGYAGQAVIGSVIFLTNNAKDVVAMVTFTIDDLEFTGTQVGLSPDIKVDLRGSDLDIGNLEQLGKAISEVERRKKW